MKKNIFLVCLLAFLTTTAFSQSFDFGFGVSAGTKMKVNTLTDRDTGFGINARGVFNFANKFGVLGGISYFLPNTSDIDATTKLKTHHIGFTADFLYNIINIPKIKLHLLGGATTFVEYRNNIINGTDHKQNQKHFCLEVGAGIKAGPLFAETKYQFNVKQFVATVGIYIK